ncbi:MAG: DNA recombination protein RmuC, partial [Cyclobacteriaceae bacterium]
MELSMIYALVGGLVVGVVIGYLLRMVLHQNKSADGQPERAQAELESARHEIIRFQSELERIQKESAKDREQLMEVNSQKAGLQSDLTHLYEKLKNQKEEVTTLQEQFAVRFKHLAQEILEEKSKKFTDQNKSNIGELLNPLKEKIDKFEKRVEESNIQNVKMSSSLTEQIKGLKELNQQMTKDTVNLTKALRGDSKTQGNWGEMQLEIILEKAGLQKDVHYFKEQNFKNEEGANQRLDYVVNLPDSKTLVLDSKVSLTAYSKFFEEEDENLRAGYLKQHLESINSHIKLLGDKNYQQLYEINQPDYVMMFVANEPALTLALREDQELYEKALNRNIVLVSTTTLLATMRTISYIWKQDMQNKNALEIARQAGSLYDKFVNFSEDLIKVGKSIDSTQKIYQEAAKKLYEGQDNLVRKSERLKELGAKTSKHM